MIRLARRLQGLLDTAHAQDFLAPLALRLYLAPVCWMAGTKKFADFESTVDERRRLVCPPRRWGRAGAVRRVKLRGQTVGSDTSHALSTRSEGRSSSLPACRRR